MTLILASQSPRRLELLKQIGVTPSQVLAPHCDETPLKDELPRQLALRLAKLKAHAIASEGLILAADTVVALGRRILPKAENDAEVAACLTLLSGRAHRVYTGVALRQGGVLRTRVVETRLQFKRLSTEEINAYLASGEGLGKAGGYAIQGLAASYVRQLSGSYANVVGLPLYEVAQLLKSFGQA